MILDPLSVLKDLVRFPSVSADSAFKQGLSDTRDYLESQLKAIGFLVIHPAKETEPLAINQARRLFCLTCGGIFSMKLSLLSVNDYC